MASTTTPTDATGFRDIWWLGGLLQLRATGQDTGGAYALVEERLRGGFAAPWHVHTREEEAFFVLEGRMTIWVGDERHTLDPGGFLNLPRDVPHAFRIDSPDGAHVIMVASPAGLEDFFRAAGDPAPAAELPPAPEGPPDLARVLEASPRFGLEVLGPPPGPDD